MQVTINRSNWLYMQEAVQRYREKNPQISFADGIGQAAAGAAEEPATNEVLDKLSGKSTQLLKDMKAGSKSVSCAGWAGLMTELKDLGAITETDYSRVPKGGKEIAACEGGGYLCLPVGDLVLVPVPPPGLTHYAPGEKSMGEVLDEICDWPGDPLEKLENMALYMRKWIGVLNVSKDDEGNPGSWYAGPFEQYESSYLNVLKKVRELMAAV